MFWILRAGIRLFTRHTKCLFHMVVYRSTGCSDDDIQFPGIQPYVFRVDTRVCAHASFAYRFARRPRWRRLIGQGHAGSEVRRQPRSKSATSPARRAPLLPTRSHQDVHASTHTHIQACNHGSRGGDSNLKITLLDKHLATLSADTLEAGTCGCSWQGWSIIDASANTAGEKALVLDDVFSPQIGTLY